MNIKAEVVERWFEAIKTTGRGLTKWELDFVESLKSQFDKTKSLSLRQIEILERIYTEKTP